MCVCVRESIYYTYVCICVCIYVYMCVCDYVYIELNSVATEFALAQAKYGVGSNFERSESRDSG